MDGAGLLGRWLEVECVSLWCGFMRVREGLERLHDADEEVQWSDGAALLRQRGARWRGCCISRDAAQTRWDSGK